VHSIPNWSPIADCQFVGKSQLEDDGNATDMVPTGYGLFLRPENRDRLVVGAGHRTQGALMELRSGLKAKVTVEFDLEQ